MPTLFKYRGISAYMYYEDIEKHNLPHFHITYGEHQASFDLEGNLLVGKLPVKKYREIKSIATDYQTEFKKAWENAVIGVPFDKIPIRK